MMVAGRLEEEPQRLRGGTSGEAPGVDGPPARVIALLTHEPNLDVSDIIPGSWALQVVGPFLPRPHRVGVGPFWCALCLRWLRDAHGMLSSYVECSRTLEGPRQASRLDQHRKVPKADGACRLGKG